MKATELTDNLLSKDRYKSFKSLMKERTAMFTATELDHGTDAVELRECRVQFEPSMMFMTREEMTYSIFRTF